MNLETPKVSVVVPIYGVEKYLRQCVDSILAQTLKDIEVILVDDGSPDACPRIADEYAARDPRVRVFHRDNQGAAAARNFGISEAKGKYLSILDSDDFFEREKLEKEFSLAEKTNADIVISRSSEFTDRPENSTPTPWSIKTNLISSSSAGRVFSAEAVKEHVFDFAVGWAWDKLFLREFVARERLRFNETLPHSEDLHFVFGGIISAKRIVVEESLLNHHRVVSHGSVSTGRDRAPGAAVDAAMDIADDLADRGLFSPETKIAFRNWACDFFVWQYTTLRSPEAKRVLRTAVRARFEPKFRILANRKEIHAYRRSAFEKYEELFGSPLRSFVRSVRRSVFHVKTDPAGVKRVFLFGIRILKTRSS